MNWLHEMGSKLGIFEKCPNLYLSHYSERKVQMYSSAEPTLLLYILSIRSKVYVLPRGEDLCSEVDVVDPALCKFLTLYVLQ